MDTKSDEKHTTIMGRKRNTTILASATSLLDSYLQDCQQQQQPSSPASSSTSQTTGDTTFEPSIDMMVNDFDDEQTLTEEEALAELEAQDPADEIETLQKESEMPLEKLLAHYRQHVEQDYQQRQRHKRKKSIKKHKSRSKQSKSKSATAVAAAAAASASSKSVPPTTKTTTQNQMDEVIVIEESDDEVEILKTEKVDTDVGEDGSVQENEHEVNADEDEDDDEEDVEFDDCSYENDPGDPFISPSEHTKLTALALLYPEKYANIQEKIYDDLSEDDDDDDEYVKKTIMVGAAYQATIPNGLSKYGDVLPYENEDKLIWEPSQVSEQEVEDYLIRVKDLKSSPNLTQQQEEEIPSSSASVTSESDQGIGSNTVKDDEQALHLLVQCGYNFNEALRRRRLNAVPLTGSMSLWSEEECRNFEEGIQKFGKDFRKIRQTQVRTRSIRELVQFYYLWKKTERRDQDFVDSDTVDHMDAYLDYDERDTGSNGGSKNTFSSMPCDTYLSNREPPSKKHHHNFSIMNETKRSSATGSTGGSSGHHSTKKSSTNKKSHRRRRSLLSGSKSKHHHHHHHHHNHNMIASSTDSSSNTTGAHNWRNSSNSSSSSASLNVKSGLSTSGINSTFANHTDK